MRPHVSTSAAGQIIAARGDATTAVVEIRLELPIEAAAHLWPGRRILAMLELLAGEPPERT